MQRAEHLPDGYAPALIAALSDPQAEVRRVAADGIRELVEVLPDAEPIQSLLTSVDPVVRGAAVYVLSSRRAGDTEQYRRAVVDDAAGVAAVRTDANREVRITVANGLGTLRTGADATRELIEDPDPLVRAAAMGSIGWDDVDATTVEGDADVRAYARRALASD